MGKLRIIQSQRNVVERPSFSIMFKPYLIPDLNNKKRSPFHDLNE